MDGGLADIVDDDADPRPATAASLETPFFGRAQAIMSAPTEGDYNSKRVKTQGRAANNRRQNAPKKKKKKVKFVKKKINE